MLRGEARSTAPFHVFGKLAHGFPRDDAPFAAGKRSFRVVNRGKDFRALALTLFPKRKRLPHGIFLAAKPSALNSLTHKRFLVRGKLDFDTP